MTEYVVNFELLITADSPEQAAEYALDDLRDVTIHGDLYADVIPLEEMPEHDWNELGYERVALSWDDEWKGQLT